MGDDKSGNYCFRVMFCNVWPLGPAESPEQDAIWYQNDLQFLAAEPIQIFSFAGDKVKQNGYWLHALTQCRHTVIPDSVMFKDLGDCAELIAISRPLPHPCPVAVP